MVKIWVKKIKDNKILSSYTLKKDEKFDAAKIFDYLTEIGEVLDTPVPIVLKKHIKHLVLYNQAKFKSSDFAETVDFDVLALENISE